MNLGEQLLAAITVAICIVLLVRLCMGAARQQRFDRAARRLGRSVRDNIRAIWHRIRRQPAVRRNATAEAQSAIDQARASSRQREPEAGDWRGNVYTPKSFRKPRKPH